MIEYATIRAARELLASFPESRAGEWTIASYRAKVRPLLRSAMTKGGGIDQMLKLAKQTKSASTWFTRRAALLHWHREMLANLLAKQDKLQRALKAAQEPVNSPQWDDWRTLVAHADMVASWLIQVRGESAPALEDRKPRHSKRKDMRALPIDWRERIIERLPKYWLAAVVQAVSGCRSDELVTGVKFWREGGDLIVEIAGSKVTERSGQPWRRLRWSIEGCNPMVWYLVREAALGTTLAKIEDAKRYSKAFEAAARREWPNRRRSVTPYCLRHAAASDMKASGMKDADISAALGHCVDKARSYYGQWQMGSWRGVAPASVEAPRPVREASNKKRPQPADAARMLRNAEVAQ